MSAFGKCVFKVNANAAKWTKVSISTSCWNAQVEGVIRFFWDFWVHICNFFRSRLLMKIVVQVPLDCDKCRSKALKIAVDARGVRKVSIEGANKDLLEVIGDDVDSFCLMKSLRKRFGCSCALVKVEEVKPAVKTVEKPTPAPSASCVQNCCTCTPHCRSMYCVLVHEDPEPTPCSIM